jgi:hypothetical protein
MTFRDLALVQGIGHTRATLRRWNAAPARIVAPWMLGSFLIACALLYIVWAISHRVTPDTTRFLLPGLNAPATPAAAAHIVARNSLVLALHAMACVAGYIAGSRLPGELDRHRGLSRRVHASAGPAAILFVGAATLFSLVTQANVLGSSAATLADRAQIGQATLILTLLPHALPELTALFLPLAAWLVASRRRRFDELLAATAATTAVAVPMLVAAAAIEVWVWPRLLLAVSPVA